MRLTDYPAAQGFSPRIPLIVVGALRSGGSGKTSMTLELARELAARGLRPAILAYRLGSGPGLASGQGSGSAASDRREDPSEVRTDSDWRASSEEAVLLRRESGVRVFVTRNRAAAWRRLHEARFQEGGAFDILLSDDGFQDPRLRGALRLLLSAPGERPGLFDLLPGGPFRETRRAAARADLRLEGPYPEAFPAPAHPSDPSGPADGPAPEGKPAGYPQYVTSGIPGAASPSGIPVFPFRRRLIPPPGFDHGRPWIVFCALGDNGPFLADLARLGIRPVAVITGRNHAAPPLKKLRAAAALHPDAGILCTRKDFLKLEAQGADLPLHPMGQALVLDPEIPDAVMAWRLLSGNRYLVHYPG